jgi:hypothetical protein
MAKDLTVKVGKKLAKKTGKGMKGTPTPKGGDVSGQALVGAAIVCPYCGAVNYCVIDTAVYNWYECWNCGGIFSA